MTAVLSPVHAVEMDSFMQEERLERVRSFNAYVESLLRAERERPAQNWSLSASALWGHDDNIALNAARVSDTFHEETVDILFAAPHDGLGPFGAGEIGAEGGLDYRNYSDRQAFDRHRTEAHPYLTTSLGFATLDAGYTFEWLRYVHNQNLDYYRHRGTTGLLFTVHPAWSHRPYVAAGVREFVHRTALGAEGDRKDSERRDLLYEIGHETFFRIFPDTRLAAYYGWERTDSNDALMDFSDHDRYFAGGSLEHEFFSLWKAVARGGWEHKKYDGRVFSVDDGTGETEFAEDDYFYGSAALFYSLSRHLKIGVTILYGQNASNNPAQEYSFSNLTAGIYGEF